MMIDLRYRLIDLARGTDSLGILSKLRSWQFQSPDELAACSKGRLESYFSSLKENVPLFRDVDQFHSLPILDKRYINAHREDLINPNYKGRLIRKKTGGSTGEPLVYFTGQESQSYLWAGIFLAWEAAGYRLGDKVAFVAGTSLFGSGYKQRIYYSLLNVEVMSAFDMAPQRMDAYAESIAKDGFRLVYGYASAIHRIALHCISQGRKVGGRLKAVVCTAEMLTSQMRRDIEFAFGVPCLSQYGCNDAGVSAFECLERNGYHLISTRSHVEVLSGGRCIATDMMNHAMYMPRYDTGDLICMSGRVCRCGRGLPLIDEVLGRQNDIVTDPRGNSVHSEFFTHMFREDMRISAFQVLFDDQGVEVNLHGPELSPANLAALSASYGERIASSLQFDRMNFISNQPFVTTANAKHRFVMRRTSS